MLISHNVSKLPARPSVLFVPFSEDEENTQLQLIAMDWIRVRKETGKDIPQLIVYKERDLSNVPNGANIYN